MITPDRPKAMQTYLLSQKTDLWTDRIGFLKVEAGDWPAIVFNEWDWGYPDWSNIGYEKWIDIFPVLIDVVVKYEDYRKGYQIRNKIREKIWKFNWKLNWANSTDWEWTISFRQFLAPSYNHETNEIVFWWIYLFKQNYDYEVLPTPTVENNANDSN